jgi:hypothetical protein
MHADSVRGTAPTKRNLNVTKYPALLNEAPYFLRDRYLKSGPLTGHDQIVREGGRIKLIAA